MREAVGGPWLNTSAGRTETRRVRGIVDTSLLRQLNRSRIFHTLRTHPGSNQKELAALTGLTPGTVSNVVREMRREGLLTGKRRPRPAGEQGRPGVSLRIAESAGLFAGVQLDMQYLTLVLTTLDGTPVASEQLDSATDLDAAVQTAVRGIERLVAEAGRPLADLRGVGVGVAGLVDHGHLLVAPYQRWVWRDVELADLFRERLGCPVYVDNDAKTAAHGERLFGAGRGHDSFVVLACYAGIGGGLYLEGSVYRGRGGLAGEIGHIKVVPGGRHCGCGGDGCLTAYASVTSIRRILRERGVPTDTTEEVARLADEGDATALEVLHAAAAHLGHALAMVVTTASPESVVLGGELTKLGAHLLPGMRAVIDGEILEQNRVEDLLVVSPLGSLQVPLGGVALAMEGFLGLPSWVSAGQVLGAVGAQGMA